MTNDNGKKQLLDGTRGTIFYMDPDDLFIEGVDGKDYGFAEDSRVKLKLDPDMVCSIRAVGVREPVIVSVVKKGEKNVAVVVDGKQRVLHARAAKTQLKDEGAKGAAGVVRVPVLPEKSMDEKLAALLMVHLNEHRREDPPLVKAEKAHRLITAQRATPEEVALAFGVKPATVLAWVAVHTSIPAVRKAVQEDLITMTHAERVAAGASEEEQEKLLAEVLGEIEKTGKVMPVSKLKARKRVHKKSKNGRGEAPKKRTLLRIIESDAAKETLSDDFLSGLKFAVGLPVRVKGLTEIAKDAEVRKIGPS